LNPRGANYLYSSGINHKYLVPSLLETIAGYMNSLRCRNHASFIRGMF
jgi:hypothetical protein